jgi:uncharacterized protein
VTSSPTSPDSTSVRLAWQHDRAMSASRETTIDARLEERERVLGVLRRHEAELRARGVTRLALFGSTARGDIGPESDVDLLIEVDAASLFAFVDLKNDLAGLLGRPVDLAFPDAMRPRLRAAVLRDAVEVWGYQSNRSAWEPVRTRCSSSSTIR